MDIEILSNSDAGIGHHSSSDQRSPVRGDHHDRTTNAYGSSSTLDGASVQSHSVTLTGLMPGTLYHYRAISADVSGNTTVSDDSTLTTLDP